MTYTSQNSRSKSHTGEGKVLTIFWNTSPDGRSFGESNCASEPGKRTGTSMTLVTSEQLASLIFHIIHSRIFTTPALLDYLPKENTVKMWK